MPSSRSSIAAVLFAGVGLSSHAAECTTEREPPESQRVTCVLERASTPATMRFVARFAGSHDDTRIALIATLDGRPLVCAPGSRTSVVAEDGEVAVDCRFLADSTGTRPVLEVALTVHHAQYLDSVLEPD